MPAEELATRLTGGVTVSELPTDVRTTVGRAMRDTDFVIAPLPNQLFMRDTSAWIYGGVSINHMYWPARQHETLNLEAVYRFHPRFGAKFPIWFGGFDHDWGGASIEGGDIMPVGDGVVLVGQGERSTARACFHVRTSWPLADGPPGWTSTWPGCLRTGGGPGKAPKRRRRACDPDGGLPLYGGRHGPRVTSCWDRPQSAPTEVAHVRSPESARRQRASTDRPSAQPRAIHARTGRADQCIVRAGRARRNPDDG